MSRLENVENIMNEYKDFVEKRESADNKKKVEMNVIKGRIEKREDEIKELDPIADKALIDEFKKSIEKEQKDIADIESSMYKSPEQKRKEELEVMDVKDETIRNLVQENKAIDYEISKKEIEFKSKTLDLGNFKYEYDENGQVKNGDEYKKLWDESDKITDELSSLRSAKQKCEEYINELREPTKDIEKINEVLSRKNKEEKEVVEESAGKQEESKEEPAKKDDEKVEKIEEQEENETENGEPTKKDEVKEEKKEEQVEKKEAEVTDKAETKSEVKTAEKDEKEKNDPADKKQKMVETINENLRKKEEEENKNPTQPKEEKATEEKTTEEDAQEKNEIEQEEGKSKIEISAKDDAVYVNGVQIKNLGIASSINDKPQMYRRLNINKTIYSLMNDKGIFRKIFNRVIRGPLLKRKLDPTVINVLSRKDESTEKADKTIADVVGMDVKRYIASVKYKTELPVDLKYDLTNSKLQEETNDQIQKYAKQANKIAGVEVLGLRTNNVAERLMEGSDALKDPDALTEADRIAIQQDEFVKQNKFREELHFDPEEKESSENQEKDENQKEEQKTESRVEKLSRIAKEMEEEKNQKGKNDGEER